MAIVRAKRKTNFTIIGNTGLKDKRLTLKAKGLLAYMLSLPDDWTFYETELTKHSKDGRDAIRSALRELEGAGYLVRNQERKDSGKFGQKEWKVWDEPLTDEPLTDEPLTDEPLTENPSAVNPTADNPTLLSTNELSTNELSTDKTNNNHQDEDAYKDLITTFQQNFGINSTKPLMLDDLKYTISDFVDQGNSYIEAIEIIKYALTIAVAHQASSWSYVKGIIKTWLSKSLFDMKSIKEYQDKPRRQGNGKQQSKPDPQYGELF